MQMMHMHQQEKKRFSNLSNYGPGQDASNNSLIFSDDSAMMMMVSDEGVF
jgi:hypothetical protein